MDCIYVTLWMWEGKEKHYEWTYDFYSISGDFEYELYTFQYITVMHRGVDYMSILLDEFNTNG